MNIEKTEIAVIFRNEKLAIKDFYLDFLKNYDNFKKENIIIDLSNNKEVSTEHILLFSETVEKHRNSGMSFVIIYSAAEIDNLPDELIVVPTLVEAKDIIEMEDIERDLGF